MKFPKYTFCAGLLLLLGAACAGEASAQVAPPQDPRAPEIDGYTEEQLIDLILQYADTDIAKTLYYLSVLAKLDPETAKVVMGKLFPLNIERDGNASQASDRVENQERPVAPLTIPNFRE